MAKKDAVANESSAVDQNSLPGGEGTKIRVAYHAGPEEIGYYGKLWQRDVAQPVTQKDWAAMQARGDFDEFNFIEEK